MSAVFIIAFRHIAQITIARLMFLPALFLARDPALGRPMRSLLAALVNLVTALTALVAWPTASFALNDEAPMKITLKVLSGIAMQEVVEDLGPKFERATGHKLAVTFANLGGAVKRIQDGETADVLIIPQSGIEGFVKDGRVTADSVAVVAYSSMGVAVRKGAPKPDISSPEAFKRTLLAAKSITYANPATGAASGQYFVTMLDRMGIANEMKPKTVLLTKPGQSPLLVASGEVELVMNQIQELMPVAGIEVVGPFPRDLQLNIVFSAAIMTGTKYPEISRQLIEFLRTPEAVAVIKAKGMEPGAP
jgi:molybdate transport system substrate-binding protein